MRLVAEVIRISYAKFRCNRLTTVGYKISNITRVSFFDTQLRRFRNCSVTFLTIV